MNILKKIKKYGFSVAINTVLRRYLGTQVGTIHYLRLNTDIVKVNEAMEGFDLDVKVLTYDDFLKGDKNVFNKSKLELIKNRLNDSNYIAYGIIENDRLIYSTWVSLRQLGLTIKLDKPILLESDEGLLEDSYCDPIARGRGLHSHMNFYRIKKLYEMGKSRILALVLEGNTPAFKVQFKSGFEDLGTFKCGYILWKKYLTLDKAKFNKL